MGSLINSCTVRLEIDKYARDHRVNILGPAQVEDLKLSTMRLELSHWVIVLLKLERNWKLDCKEPKFHRVRYLI
jgi:hypothetical protein